MAKEQWVKQAHAQYKIFFQKQRTKSMSDESRFTGGESVYDSLLQVRMVELERHNKDRIDYFEGTCS